MLSLPLFARYKPVLVISLPTSSCPLSWISQVQSVSMCMQAERKITDVSPPYLVMARGLLLKSLCVCMNDGLTSWKNIGNDVICAGDTDVAVQCMGRG